MLTTAKKGVNCIFVSKTVWHTYDERAFLSSRKAPEIRLHSWDKEPISP